MQTCSWSQGAVCSNNLWTTISDTSPSPLPSSSTLKITIPSPCTNSGTQPSAINRIPSIVPEFLHYRSRLLSLCACALSVHRGCTKTAILQILQRLCRNEMPLLTKHDTSPLQSSFVDKKTNPAANNDRQVQLFGTTIQHHLASDKVDVASSTCGVHVRMHLHFLENSCFIVLVLLNALHSVCMHCVRRTQSSTSHGSSVATGSHRLCNNLEPIP